MPWIELTKSNELTLTRQIYDQLRRQILHKELQPGEKLPSSRELADSLSVSRNVVLETYEQLIAEGYLESIPSSGTFVADGAFLNGSFPESLPQDSLNRVPEKNHSVISFRSGIPALDLLPRKKWSSLVQQVSLDWPPQIFGYDTPEGRLELREAICRYLKKNRGVNCHPEQLLIISGAVQGFSMITNLFLGKEDYFAIEDPIHLRIKSIFSSTGAVACPIPVDENGMQTHLLPSQPKPKLIMITPSHQYPLGGILPIQRRIELIQYARTMGSYIIEDDYDSEFRYEGHPISSLQGLDPERVIYIGTFSKVLFPALRIGYLILPYPLIEKFRNLKLHTDHHSHTLDQLALARFIDEGLLERHIARMKKIYRTRRNTLIACLKDTFQDNVTLWGQSTGLHLIADFHGCHFSQAIRDALLVAGVHAHPVNIHMIANNAHDGKLILGYSHLTNEEIQTGVQRLSQVLQSLVNNKY